MKKSLILWIFFLIFASCSPLTKTQRMEREMFDPQRKQSKRREANRLTPEQAAEVRKNGGFNPYYVAPKRMKVKMPNRHPGRGKR